MDKYFDFNTAMAEMFKRQNDFQHRVIGDHPSELRGTERMAYLREQALALISEVHEALDETGWKSWATSNHINDEAYKGELTDVWIFLMNLMMIVGMAPEELVLRTIAKQTVNVARQEIGYDGVSTKCPQCHRAYDDVAVKCIPSHAEHGPWCDYYGPVNA